MAKVTIYTSMLCGFCAAAKQLLDKKGAAYDEIDVTLKPGARAKMSAQTGGRTSVPQIFVGDYHVGGCDDLFELESDGKLEPLLASE